MRYNWIVVAVSAAIAFVSAFPAYANIFGIVAAGCVPDAATIKGDRYRTGGHGVFMKGSGTARLLCPIPITRGTWKSFDLYYKDPDGSQPQAEVRAFLKQAKFDSSTVGTTICTVSSHNNPNPSSGYKTVNCNFDDFSPSTSEMDPEFGTG